jgi:hypothetical protein
MHAGRNKSALGARAKWVLFRAGKLRGGRSSENIAREIAAEDVRQGIANCAVMLRLHSRYVSKAAILPVPVPLVPVENRSPA